MGYYINPPNMTKEEWLAFNGRKLSGAPARHRFEDDVAVCLLDNGAFTAAGICYSQQELEAFQGSDGRRRRWFYVHREKIYKLHPYFEGIVQ